MAEIIDVSRFQPGSVDFHGAAAAGVAGIYCKATDGKGSPDDAFLPHVEHAHGAGLPVGGYTFLRVRHQRPQDAEAQCIEFLTRYFGAGCELLPMVDLEDGMGPDKKPTENFLATPDEWLEAIRTWVATCQAQAGCLPFLYTYPWWWKKLGPKLAAATDLADCGLWIADYEVRPSPIILAPWTDWDVWQYTDKGSLPGLSPVDRSRSKGPIDTLRRPLSAPPSDVA